METIAGNGSTQIARYIPILPMRHGNFDKAKWEKLKARHSDPTYEAWKLLLIRLSGFQADTFRSYL